MKDNGWIKLHRKLFDSLVFKDANLFHLFCYCILKANHKPTETFFNGELHLLEPGQFISGRFKIAQDLGVNPNTIYKRLKKLQKLQTICVNGNNKFSIITVINYSTYQQAVTTKEQQSNNKVTTKEQQSNTDKKYKNEKNDKKGESVSPVLESSFQPKKLFKDTELFNFETFQTQFTNHPDYNGYDARHYYGVMRDYSASNNKATADWIAYAYQIVRRDTLENKAVKFKDISLKEKAKLAAEGKLA